jgi:hypothetical protein
MPAGKNSLLSATKFAKAHTERAWSDLSGPIKARRAAQRQPPAGGAFWRNGSSR